MVATPGDRFHGAGRPRGGIQAEPAARRHAQTRALTGARADTCTNRGTRRHARYVTGAMLTLQCWHTHKQRH
eukprot:6547668-Lingulodinium_polyedra.AAC.1